jgi:enolase
LPYNSKELSEKANTTPEEIITLFNNSFSKALTGYDIEQFTAYDKYILNLVQNATDTDLPIISLLGHSLSVSTLLAMARMNNSNNIEFINSNIPLFKLNNVNIPDLGFILFKTGKEMNSKVKFERWILFLNNAKKLPYNDLKDAFSKIYLALRKFLTAGKAGEAGMRLNEEGSYFPPTDVMNDIIKLLENIINEIGMADSFYFGIDCNGNNYYNQETNTYEMDGFKKPPDNDQLIEFFVKLCKDHPLLKYLEDPLSDTDLRGYSKLMDKFATECPDVKIVLKRLVQDKINNLSNIIDKEEEKQGTGGTKMNTLNP